MLVLHLAGTARMARDFFCSEYAIVSVSVQSSRPPSAMWYDGCSAQTTTTRTTYTACQAPTDDSGQPIPFCSRNPPVSAPRDSRLRSPNDDPLRGQGRQCTMHNAAASSRSLSSAISSYVVCHGGAYSNQVFMIRARWCVKSSTVHV